MNKKGIWSKKEELDLLNFIFNDIGTSFFEIDITGTPKTTRYYRTPVGYYRYLSRKFTKNKIQIKSKIQKMKKRIKKLSVKKFDNLDSFLRIFFQETFLNNNSHKSEQNFICTDYSSINHLSYKRSSKLMFTT